MTHGVLPDGLPPLCRWRWGDILDLSGRLKDESIYGLAKAIGVSRAVLRNLMAWISRADPKVLALAREAGFLEALPPPPAPAMDAGAGALALAYRWPKWPAFTHAFSRVLYPKRFPLWPSHMNLTG